jgi:hypothetical protein
MKETIKFLILVLAGFGCVEKSEYQKVVEKELKTETRFDSLFYAFYFGMPADDFYAYCWDMNKKGEFMEGSSNAMVKTEVLGLPYRANFEFYPLFKDNRVQSMICSFNYPAWAPWNTYLNSENLIEDLRVMLQIWYGGQFFETKRIGIGKTYTMIQGNRRIVLYYEQDNRVEVLFSDLTNLDDIIKTEQF